MYHGYRLTGCTTGRSRAPGSLRCERRLRWLRAPCAAICLSMIVALASADGWAQESEALRQIEADWRTRLLAVRAIEYTAKGTQLVKKGAYNEDFNIDPKVKGYVPPEDHQKPLLVRVSLDLTTGSVRKQTHSEALKFPEMTFVPSEMNVMFDGYDFQRYTPLEENSHLGVNDIELFLETPAFRGLLITKTDYPFFLGHGLVPRAGVTIGLGKEMVRPTTLPGFVVAGEAVQDGRRQLVIRSRPSELKVPEFNEFWVDLERQSAVTRWSVTRGSSKVVIDLRYKQEELGWFPVHWTWSSHEAGRLSHFQEFEVTSVVFNPSFDRDVFHVTPAAGMNVMDRSTGRAFRVPAAGEEAIDLVEARKAALNRPTRRTKPSVAIYLLVAGAIVCLAGVILSWARRAKELKR